jgi:hypothetical protein
LLKPYSIDYDKPVHKFHHLKKNVKKTNDRCLPKTTVFNLSTILPTTITKSLITAFPVESKTTASIKTIATTATATSTKTIPTTETSTSVMASLKFTYTTCIAPNNITNITADPIILTSTYVTSEVKKKSKYIIKYNSLYNYKYGS